MKKNHSNPSLGKEEYYMYGKHAVLAAINNPKRTIKKIYCIDKLLEPVNIALKNRNHPIEIEVLNNDAIRKKFRIEATHQGIIALVKSCNEYNIEKLQFTSEKDRVLILDQITDPQNIGTIIRSAAAFGIDKIILPKDNSPEENASIAKTACGCLELVQIVRITNLNQTIKKLKNLGFWVVGMDTKGTQDFSIIKNIDKIAIIIGSEDSGMRRLTSEACDYHISIPISNQVESLNAASAASIMFFMTSYSV
ncbi:MAG: 23S rRNA (guanosine(2251)-2'-O)-methyltransferase RlmB [Rickettsiaceae bacterium]|nr:23S rRNA (guanosine(2251)-2'-O)-methyltransferase RlmB [Rickettsiaceae bacterium]